MRKLYDTNEGFKHYVDGYCKKEEISVEEALTHKIVQITADYYKDAEKGKVYVSSVTAGCGAASGGDCK